MQSFPASWIVHIEQVSAHSCGQTSQDVPQLITTLARHAFSWSTPQAMQEVSLHDQGAASTRFTTSPSRALLPHTTCKHAGQESSSTAGSTGFFALRPLHEYDLLHQKLQSQVEQTGW